MAIEDEEGLSSEELARAQTAFRGSLESARAWRSFSPDPRHHDMTYWTMLSVLFAEPGMNRTTLIERIVDYAGVSRSTAERAIREGRARGFIADEPVGKEVRYRLTDATFRHCVRFFRSHLDLDKVMKNLGYSRVHQP
ncbi:hypothetical protein [Benzoatithermus flavus]|uniref:MarR family transcriptional regulator n=1 Tax=Benzoatithermus flavus TaxID=3108223 RepID=A0ABU8XYM2_9PROT